MNAVDIRLLSLRIRPLSWLSDSQSFYWICRNQSQHKPLLRPLLQRLHKFLRPRTSEEQTARHLLSPMTQPALLPTISIAEMWARGHVRPITTHGNSVRQLQNFSHLLIINTAQTVAVWQEATAMLATLHQLCWVSSQGSHRSNPALIRTTSTWIATNPLLFLSPFSYLISLGSIWSCHLTLLLPLEY